MAYIFRGLISSISVYSSPRVYAEHVIEKLGRNEECCEPIEALLS